MADFVPVDSSVMSHVMHDGNAMHIRYKSGKTYIHDGVSAEHFDGFLKSDSKGKYFNSHISKQYPGTVKG